MEWQKCIFNQKGEREKRINMKEMTQRESIEIWKIEIQIIMITLEVNRSNCPQTQWISIYK